jgi:hypothetical protein
VKAKSGEERVESLQTRMVDDVNTLSLDGALPQSEVVCATVPENRFLSIVLLVRFGGR